MAATHINGDKMNESELSRAIKGERFTDAEANKINGREEPTPTPTSEITFYRGAKIRRCTCYAHSSGSLFVIPETNRITGQPTPLTECGHAATIAEAKRIVDETMERGLRPFVAPEKSKKRSKK